MKDFIFRESQLLLRNTTDIELPSEEVAQRCLKENFGRDWFTEKDREYSAILLESDAPTPAECRWVRIRTLFAANNPLASLAVRALGLLNWRKSARFCGFCGGAMVDDKYETARRCTTCERILYPRLSPTVMVLVEKGDSILLVRHSDTNTDNYTCIAGYVEHGESLEDCAIREVRDETSLEITNIRYQGSQCWPYPDQLMATFRADWAEGEIILQDRDIRESAWFRKDNLPEIPKPGTIAHDLIKGGRRN
ncbi:MAG: NAD(+) diphosphatase [Spirochaetaceae bacterium]|jgi:NAD+ diphosphatase|nr:NAD(+) diphosphatase [Spirochaetaceae bacterium]